MKRMDYDESTDAVGEENAKKFARELGGWPGSATLMAVNGHTRGWDDARAHDRESLAIALRALEKSGCDTYTSDRGVHGMHLDTCRKCAAIAEITKRGDYIPEGNG